MIWLDASGKSLLWVYARVEGQGAPLAALPNRSLRFKVEPWRPARH